MQNLPGLRFAGLTAMVWLSLSAAQDAVSSFGTAASAMTLCILRIHVASGGQFETLSTLQSVFGSLRLHTLLYSALTHAACLQAAPWRSSCFSSSCVLHLVYLFFFLTAAASSCSSFLLLVLFFCRSCSSCPFSTLSF